MQASKTRVAQVFHFSSKHKSTVQFSTSVLIVGAKNLVKFKEGLYCQYVGFAHAKLCLNVVFVFGSSCQPLITVHYKSGFLL